MKKVLIVVLLIIAACYYLLSQEVEEKNASFDRSQALKIYLDCAYCDMQYFRSEFTSVNYVTERLSADVYILVTALETGTGGTEYTAIFKGRGKFQSMIDTLVFYVEPNASTEITRIEILNNLQLGLVPYLIKTPAKEYITLFIDEESFDQNLVVDKWNNWRFDIGGNARLNNQKSSKSYGMLAYLDISKVTEEIKFNFNTMFSFDEASLDLYDGDTIIFSSFISQRSISSSVVFVKSLGNHCGLGGVAGYMSSEYFNLRNQIAAGPAVEFNIYNYADVSQREFRFLYRLYYQFSDYYEETIYGKMEDHRFIHDLHIIYSIHQDWGDINAIVGGTNYLSDPSIFSVGAEFSAYYAVPRAKGLRLNLSASFSYVQDQIGLRKETVSPEEFLLGQSQVETDYMYHFSFGISYNFGSDIFNVVNPRFSGW